MWLRNHVANPVVRAISRSRAHAVLGSHLVLLGYTGRRTGRAYELPVMAAPAGTDLVVRAGQHDAKTWWRNFTTTPQQVTVRSGGRVRDASARRLAAGEPGYDEAVASYRRTFPRSGVEPAAPVLLLVPHRAAGRRAGEAGPPRDR
ncbi:nitroreductase/quinone reductase family protein [Blastococcus sp. SYSU D01042]